MKITKREFIQIGLGGLVADSIIAKVDAEAGLPHTPTNSRVQSVLAEHNERDENFWGKANKLISGLVIVPSIMYARFESSELNAASDSSRDPYSRSGIEMSYDGPGFHPSHRPGSMTEGFKQGHMPFSIDPFSSVRSKTRGETSLYLENKLSAPEYFAAFGASIILDRSTSDKDVSLFERNIHFEFLMGSRCYAREQAARITSRADMDKLVRRGQPTEMMAAKQHRWDPPIIIENNIHFHFLLQNPRKVSGFGEFGGSVMLDGYYAQGVC